MKDFNFIFDGEANADGTIDAGIRVMTGDVIEIAHTLGTYASAALKTLREPAAAIIIINAFKKFMELNPDLTEDILRKLSFNDGARIIQPGKRDSLGQIVDISKTIKKN